MSDQPTSIEWTTDRCLSLVRTHLEAAADESTPAPQAVDSIVLIEALISIEEELGIEVPMDEDTAVALRSVDSLSELLRVLLAEAL